MPVYENLIDALKDLKARGFTTDFNIAFDTLICNNSGTRLKPEEFEIVEHYRFEADTNPSDSSVIYAVKAAHGNLKGVLISAYGVYSDEMHSDMIQKLGMHE